MMGAQKQGSQPVKKKNETEQVPTIVKGLTAGCTGYFTREKQYEPPQQIKGKSQNTSATPRHVSCF